MATSYWSIFWEVKKVKNYIYFRFSVYLWYNWRGCFVFFLYEFNSRGPNLRIRDNFSAFISKVWCIWSHFREGGPLLRPGKIFYAPKTNVTSKTDKGKEWVKNWRFLKVVFNGNDRYYRIEHEILSKNSIIQQVPYLNTQKNTAIWSLKYCQFEYDWRQILSKS